MKVQRNAHMYHLLLYSLFRQTQLQQVGICFQCFESDHTVSDIHCLTPLFFCVPAQTYTVTLGKRVHTFTLQGAHVHTTGYHIFMTCLSGVTTVHIHLFSISMIDIFFMLPLGLKQYTVQVLCIC